MSNQFIKFIVIFIIIVQAYFSEGQAFKVETLSLDEGLSQGMIFDIHKDLDGFMWFATKNGLNRYDGYEFKVFTHNPFNTTSISGDVITIIFEDSKGRLWIGTKSNGLNCYDKLKNEFHRIKIDNDSINQFGKSQINAIEEDNDGTIWVAIKNHPIVHVKTPDPKSPFQFNVTTFLEPNYLTGKENIGSLKKVSDGRILIGANSHVMEWNGHRIKTFCKIEDEQLGIIPNIIEYPKNTIWVCSRYSISKIKNNQVLDKFSIKNFTANKKGAGFIIHFNEFDKKINVCFYYKSIIYEIDPLQDKIVLEEKIKIDEDVYFPSMYYNNNQTLWLGTNGYGIRKIAKRKNKFRHIAKGKSVRLIRQADDGKIYITHKVQMEVSEKGKDEFVDIDKVLKIKDKGEDIDIKDD